MEQGKTKKLLEELIGKKTKSNFHAIYIFFTTGFIAVVYMLFHQDAISILLLSLTFLWALLCYIRQILLNIRWTSGLYGTTETEAREIIQYFIEQRSKNGGGGYRLEFPPEEVKELVVESWEEGEGYV